MSERPSGLGKRQTLQIIMGVAGALAFVHKQGVLHLDIHGGNIFLTSCGDNTVACLADFGMAYVSEDETRVPGFRVHPDVNRAPELFFAPGASLKRNGGPVKYTLQYVPPRAIEKKLYAPPSSSIRCVIRALSASGTNERRQARAVSGCGRQR